MRTSARAVLIGSLAFAALIASLPLSGCGSGKSSAGASASRKKGSVSFTIAWPEQTRVIPQASNSIRLTLVRTPGGEIPTPTNPAPVVVTINRPETTVTVNNLELGPYTVTAEAFPLANATGVVQARATVTTTVVEDTNTPLTLTMDATIASVTLAAAAPFDQTLNAPKRVGDVIQLIPTARDAANNIVLTTFGTGENTIEWSVTSGANVATVDNNGRVTVTGLGTATIRARYEEPGVTPGNEGTGDTITYTLTSVPTGLSTDPWPKFRGDNQNTGQATRGASVTTSTFAPGNWPFQTNSSIVFASPVVTEPDTNNVSTIYVGAQDGNLYALTSAGALKWRFQTGGPVEATPTLGKDGTIYVGSMGGKFYALKDAGTSATKVWEFNAEGPVFASATISNNGILYFGTVSNSTTQKATFFALDSLTGRELWFYTDPNLGTGTDGVQTTAALSPDEKTVYYGSLNGFVYALWTGKDAGDPQPQATQPSESRQGRKAQRRWRSAQFGTLFSSAPVLGTTTTNGLTVYIGSLDNRVYALNANSGGTIWSYDAAAPVYSTVALRAGGQVLYVATLDNVSGTDDSKIAAIRADTGAQIWRTQSGIFSDGFTSSPAISNAGDVLYIGNFNGKIYGINATVDVSDPANPLPTANSGNITWTLTTPPPAAGQPDNNIESSPAVGADGTVYLGGFSGEIYAIK
jgi:outer membrane protein assembly factor BamB